MRSGRSAARFLCSFGSAERSKSSSSSSGLKRLTYFSSSLRTPCATKPRWLISDSAGSSAAAPATTGCSGTPLMAGAPGTGRPSACRMVGSTSTARTCCLTRLPASFCFGNFTMSGTCTSSS